MRLFVRQRYKPLCKDWLVDFIQGKKHEARRWQQKSQTRLQVKATTKS
jgi:hypothetical protein